MVRPQAAAVPSDAAAVVYLEHHASAWTVIPLDPIFTFELTLGVWLLAMSSARHACATGTVAVARSRLRRELSA
jgi:hypothetical protein